MIKSSPFGYKGYEPVNKNPTYRIFNITAMLGYGDIDHSKGSIVEQILAQGLGEFCVIDKDNAVLVTAKGEIPYEATRQLVWYYEREATGRDLGCDLFGGAYDTEAEAVLAADESWRYLTAAERKTMDLVVYRGSAPAYLSFEEAMDYIIDNGTGGHHVLTFSAAAPVTVELDSDYPSDAYDNHWYFVAYNGGYLVARPID